MFKECKVLSYNKFLNILVFDYDGKQIQTTVKLDDGCKTVYVKYEDGVCEFVDKEKYMKMVSKNKKKSEKVINVEDIENVPE